MVKKPNLETSQVSQYCLDTLTVQEFLRSLPKPINVYNLRFRGTFRSIRKQLQIAEYIKQMGVTRAATTAEAIDVRGNFMNNEDKQKILQNIERIAKSFSMPPQKFHIEHVTLMDKNQTSSLTFRRMYKQIRFPNDKRRKKLVLGMVEGKGSNYHSMLAEMSAKKIVCTLAKTEKTIVLCSEEVAKK